MLFPAFLRKALHKVEGFPRVLFGKGREGVKAFTEPGEAHRDDGNAVYRRPEGFELPHGVQQLFPVVETGAADDLAVHDDAGLRKAAHDVNALPGLRIPEHFAAQLRVHGVYRDVDGAHMQGDDALHLTRREIRERDVVAEQEAQARVVVFKIHGFAHAAGELVNEAEDTGVGAGARRVHQVALKIEPQVAALRLFDMQRILRADAPGQRTRRVDRLYIVVFHPGSLLSHVIAGR